MTEENETNETHEGPYHVLLTDGTSALGAATVRALVAAGHTVSARATTTVNAADVRALGALPVFLDTNRAGEVHSAIDMTKATVIVDTAAQAANIPPFLVSDYTPELLLAGTQALVNGAKAAETDVQLIVYPGFAFAYGDADGAAVDETHALSDSKDPLVAAARQSETLVLNAGIPACVLRAGYLYGPNQAMQHTADALRASKALPTGDGHDNYAGWIYTSDLAAALALAVTHQSAGEVYNIVDDSPITPSAFLHQFGQALGISEDQFFGAFMKMFSFGGNANKTLLSFSAKPSNTKAKAALGWQPKYADYAAGIDEMLLAWRATMHL